MDFLLGLLLMIFLIPIVTGHAAKQRGLSFWKWFLLGCILPGISFFILAVVSKDNE